MNEILFYIKSFNGKGWFLPLRDVLKGTRFYDQAIFMGDEKVFNLADVRKLIMHQKLQETLSKLNLDKKSEQELESILSKKIENLELFDRKQTWIFPSAFIITILVYLSIIYSKDNKPNYNTNIQSSSSVKIEEPNSKYKNNSPSISPNNYPQKTYTVSNSSYAFAKTESDFERLMNAVRLNDIETISLMRLNGNIKTFPSGKKIFLIDQGLSTIKIMDPETGIYYFGTTESIK